MFFISENFCFAQERSENVYDARPSHEFISGERFDQITERRELYYKPAL